MTSELARSQPARRLLAAVLACALGCGLLCTPAAAEEPDREAYDRAIEAALERYRARDWAAAQAGFERAHALDPGARTARGIGLSAYYAQDYARAARAFEQALSSERHALSPEQRAQTQALLTRSYALVARFRVDSLPAGAATSLNGERIPDGTAVALTPGRYHLEVRLEGHEPHEREIDLAAGQTLDLQIALRIASPPAPALAPPPLVRSTPTPEAPAASTPVAVSQAAPTRGRLPAAATRRGFGPWPWIAAGSTLALAAAAVGFGLAGNEELDQLRERCAARCTVARRAALWNDSPIQLYETLTNVALAAAGAAAVTTVTLFVLVELDDAPASEPPPPARSTTVGLQLAGRF